MKYWLSLILLLMFLAVKGYTPDTYTSVGLVLEGSYTPDSQEYVSLILNKDTCTCPGAGINHEFNCSDHCNVSFCTAANITFTNTGNVTCIEDTTTINCYQETANEISIVDGNCSQDYSGNYMFDYNDTWGGTANAIKLIDGDWDTETRDYFEGSTEKAYLYINYSKPPRANNNSLWKIKDGYQMTNLSIPVGCWNQNPLQFRVMSYYRYILGDTYAAWACYNGVEFETIISYHDDYPAETYYKIYEEAMYWNINTGWNIDNLGDPGSGCTLYIDNGGLINIG